MAQKIRIKLKSFDYNLVDKSSERSDSITNKKRNFYRT